MALKLSERYPGRFNIPSAGYPQGSFKNRTAPGAKDGSYLEKDWANDKEGFFQSLLSGAGIAPNGDIDQVGSSQYYTAMLKILASAQDPWALQPIGVPIPIYFDGATQVPPIPSSGYRYIKLTAADSYNSGVLTGEAVSGSSPLIIATATINLAGSPINGLSVNLINTERRFLRGGAVRTVEQDTIQGHSHQVNSRLANLSESSNNPVLSNNPSTQVLTNIVAGTIVTDGINGTPRIGNETKSKNIGVTFYMRIK